MTSTKQKRENNYVVDFGTPPPPPRDRYPLCDTPRGESAFEPDNSDEKEVPRYWIPAVPTEIRYIPYSGCTGSGEAYCRR